MKNLTLLLFIAVLLTACQPAATSQPLAIPPTVIPPTVILPNELPVPTPTSAPAESPVSSPSDLVGIWLFSQAEVKLEFKADGTYRVFSGSETLDEGNYAVDAGKLTWVTGHPTCNDQPATYEVYLIKRDNKPVGLRMHVVGSDPCSDRAGVLRGNAKFINP